MGLTATTVSALTMDDLRRMRLVLRVEGPRPITVGAVPTAITETTHDRRLTLRPAFGGSERAGIERLIDAMLLGERVVAEVGGRALEPTFSLRGFAAVWEKGEVWCR